MSNDLTLLQLVQTAAKELGLTAPSVVVGSTDLQTVQLLALMNRDGIELYQSKDWTTLQGEHIINVETPTTLTGAVTLNSQTCTVTSTVGLSTAYSVTGTGQPAAQRIQTVVDSTTLTLEMESTATAASTSLIFARDTYTLPSDFDHYISRTWWDRTNHWALMGPQSPQFDQWQRSGVITTGPRIRWRQIGHRPTAWRIWPPPTSQTVPDSLVFEYVNDGWVAAADGTYKKRFTLDTDTSLLDDDALILGCKWRMWQIKGFSYGAMQQEYCDYVNRIKSRDGGMPDLKTNRQSPGYLITSANVQDGNYPGG